ncbi:MAG: SURF1 family protein [Gammaproteobacteria bacterium]|nr:SURF1 family protein [Gammaproteobacteria bacterium]
MKRIVPIVVSAILLPLFIGLGLWQLDRATQRQAIKVKIMQRSEIPAQELPAEVDDASQFEYYHFKFTGEFESEYQIFLDNQIHQGQAGYHVIAPVKVASTETRVLVNRGWIPGGESREQLPAVETPAGNLEIVGRAVAPPADYFTLESEDSQSADWQTLWQNLDMEKIQSRLPFPIYPIVIQQDADAGAKFVRAWPDYDDNWIQRHRAYAFQWFSLAALLVVIWVVFAVRARRGQKA